MGHHFTATAGGKTYDPLQSGPRDGVNTSDVKGSIVIDDKKSSASTGGTGSSDIIEALGMQTGAIVNAIQALAKAVLGKEGGSGGGLDDVLDRNLLESLNTLSFLRTGNI